MLSVVNVSRQKDYKVLVKFNDGKSGVIDFKEILEHDHRNIIRELLNLNMFKTVKIQYDTLTWDNGVDFAPEYLYEVMR
ncbi:MAG: DUF2442 domain-containing protein [Fusobacteriaceae bacterium]|jgi:hypothetical protein|nr:DUF2442 domain-containing protein [Fusobacteriaceae bacterium]